jgi:phenylacetate-CoA ligase
MQTLRLRELQLHKLNRLLNDVWERNPFYTHKWCEMGVPHHHLESLEQLADFPFTTRDELLQDQRLTPPLGTNFSQPLHHYKRIHRSSGVASPTLYWADTAANWRWVLHCTQTLFLYAGVEPRSRLFFALSFTNGSRSWTLYEGACQLGSTCFTGGDTDIKTQLSLLRQFAPDTLVAGPERLHELAQTAFENGMSPAKLGIRRIISFGRVNWSFESVRSHARDVWKAEAFDRYGMTEVGPVAGECCAHPGGMHLLETEYVAEVIDPNNGKAVEEGQPGELVLTNLGRIGRPVVRYRTGDLVKLNRSSRCPCGRTEALLMGGITRVS